MNSIPTFRGRTALPIGVPTIDGPLARLFFKLGAISAEIGECLRLTGQAIAFARALEQASPREQRALLDRWIDRSNAVTDR